MDIFIISIAIGGGFALGGLLFIIYGLVSTKNNVIGKRMQEFVVDRDQINNGSNVKKVRVITREFSGSLLSRTITPIFRNIIGLFGQFTPVRTLEKVEHQLNLAGNPYNLRAREFYGMRFVFLVLGVAIALLINIQKPQIDFTNILLGVCLVLIFLLLPDMWLRQRISKAQENIRRSLPDALDMLSVCATAGLGFDQAMQKVSDTWDTPLGYEFRRVSQEMEMGISRVEALRNLSSRLDVSELSSFVAVIIQADILGMRIADVLHSQAEQMRILRHLRAKEIVNKLPAKIMVPLAFLILPALLAVILGPMIPMFLKMLERL